MSENYLNLDGIEFVEFASADPDALHRLFVALGFSRTKIHQTKKIDLYEQNQIRFLLNREPSTFAETFQKTHGPCISSMGWRVKDAEFAVKTAVERGANKSDQADYERKNLGKTPAIFGIGESLIYFIDRFENDLFYDEAGFVKHPEPVEVTPKGFMLIDHLTNNVFKGTMDKWSSFYKDVFGFTEVRYFDIRGKKTGLTSYALRSPCGKFCIPINEADEKKSQINEYLDEYKGPGVQHLALATPDILQSLKLLENSSVEMLDIDDDYYDEAFKRVPNVTEDRPTIQKYKVLIDGDEEGYLLQIFTKNIIGPIFFEIIQRKNHNAFGEGNFGALFRAIERDQEKRGVFNS